MCNGNCSISGETTFQVGDIAIAKQDFDEHNKGQRILVGFNNLDYFNVNNDHYHRDDAVSPQEIENFRLSVAEDALKRAWEVGEVDTAEEAINIAFNIADKAVAEYQMRRLL